MSSATFASRTSVGEIGAVDEKLLSRQRQLVQLPELRLHEEATRTLRYELDLPADERRRHVIGRLRAWLTLDMPDAKRIATAFDTALDQLEVTRREVFMLVELEELSVVEVARALEIPVNTAYSRLRLAREDFKATLLRRGAP